MSWGQDTVDTIRDLEYVRRRLDGEFVGRDRAVRLLQLAVVCREHALLLGPTGTAKSELISALARHIEARRFSYLLTRFTEPSEIFGALDFEQFRQGTYQVRTEGMLPSAELVFLDEVFQGSSAILNTLLTLLNERRYHNGALAENAPLISLLGATNEIPDDPGLTAFSDRFLIRLQVEPVGGTDLERLLQVGWEHETRRFTAAVQAAEQAAVRARGTDTPARTGADRTAGTVTVDRLGRLTLRLRDVDLDPVLGEHRELVRQLLIQGVRLSDRRLVRSLKLVAGAALLRESRTAAPVDLWPLAHIWTDPADRTTVEEAVQAVVEKHGGEPGRRRRPDHEILLDAREIGAPLISGRQPSEWSVVEGLHKLADLSRELREHPPVNTQTETELSRIIAEVNALLDQFE
ncbi:AAA family ATPase [Streptomyces alanosinicus]|uniref:AAA family ATPase n=1 Tax=Streptomyces alanosinicus TaxID=68171 RepID=A0A918YMQ7_9ACTN|nr:AAA family ATPase [Streptomyces alanosinicus]GHE08708.1 AAA family ATPase [Streptomyces alanosinicus]